MAPRSLYSKAIGCFAGFYMLCYDACAGTFSDMRGGHPRGVSHTLSKNSGMNRLQEFLDNPHIITGTATVAADRNLRMIAANKARHTLVGKPPSHCRNRTLTPSLDRTIFRRAYSSGSSPGPPPPFRLGRGFVHKERHLRPHPPLPAWEWASSTKARTRLRFRRYRSRLRGGVLLSA